MLDLLISVAYVNKRVDRLNASLKRLLLEWRSREQRQDEEERLADYEGGTWSHFYPMGRFGFGKNSRRAGRERLCMPSSRFGGAEKKENDRQLPSYT